MLSELEREMLEALKWTWGVIDAAGLINLSNGVQLGQTAWYIKAKNAEEYALVVIARAEAKERETAQQAHERMLALRLAECPDDVEFYR